MKLERVQRDPFPGVEQGLQRRRQVIPDADLRKRTRRGQVFTLLLVAFVITAVSQTKFSQVTVTEDKKGNGGAQPTSGNKSKSNQSQFLQTLLTVNLPAWAVVWITLTLLSDFDESADFAVAFAFLILLGVLLFNGPKAFDNVQHLVNPVKTAKKG